MNVIIHGHGRINPQLNNKYVEKCILLGFTYMQEVRVCMCVCGDHIYEFEYLCVPILSHSILCIPLRGMDPSHIPISSEAKESLQKHHKKMRIKGSIFCNSADIRWCQRCGFVPSKLSTLKPLKVQGLTVWFKMSWYAHFIFLLLSCWTILIFVSGPWVFECMYSKYDVCAVVSLVELRRDLA